MDALYLVLCIGLLVLAMAAAHWEGLSYPWRVWAVLLPPLVLAYVGIRRLHRAWAARAA